MEGWPRQKAAGIDLHPRQPRSSGEGRVPETVGSKRRAEVTRGHWTILP